jgi:predicted MFS family arabinose efflux permease
MVTTYIGELYPPEGRTKVMGRLISVRSISSIISPLIIGYVAARSNWRIGFASFGLFLSIISLILVYFGIPKDRRILFEDEGQLAGILAVFRNRSALSYLFAGSLSMALFTALSVFNGSYLRQNFALTVKTTSQILPITSIFITVGLLVSGFLVDRFGLVKVVYLSTFLSAVFYLFYFAAMLPLLPALIFSILGSLMLGIRLAVGGTLGLVQETTYRGSMMSLNTAFMNLGGVLGAMIGGYALLSYGYRGLGIVSSGLSVIASIIYFLWVKNP